MTTNTSKAFLEEETFYDSHSGVAIDDDGKTRDLNETQTFMTEEEKQKQREEWQEELMKTEEEIQTLRQVLSSKLRHANDLKHKLGISTLTEMKHDLQHGLNNIKSTDTFQKTAAVVRVAKDKTSSTLSTASSKVSEKWGVWRNSNTFKSVESKFGTAYTTMKSKIVGSGSGGVQSGGVEDNLPNDSAGDENRANETNASHVDTNGQQNQPQ